MNAGLGSLTLLKSRLLPAQSAAQTDTDAAILRIGLGVERWFAHLCDRRFARQADDLYLCRADRTYVVVPRYPLESVSLIEQQVIGDTAWSPCPAPYLLFPESGLIDFAAALGSTAMILRVTFTGGYWFDETEDGSGTAPTGSIPLPGDLLYAWLDQCAFLFERRNKLGLEKLTHAGTFTVNPVDLLPHVRAVLANYRRHSLT
jgi:hypothetical protein